MTKILLMLILVVFNSFSSGISQERISVIIGTNKGLKSERQLSFAVSDAKKVKAVLQELGRFQPSRCYLLTNPSLHTIEKTFDEVKGRIKEIRESGRDVEFLIYYSGHGSNSSLHINGETLSHAKLLSTIETVQANLTIAIVDACYSGALVNQKGLTLAPPLSLKLTDTLSAQGTILLTSSSSDQTSHESSELHGSIFTHHMISALRGAADYDQSGTVSLGEAYSYARMKTSKVTGSHHGGLQKPSYSWNIKGSEEISLSWLEQSSSSLYMKEGVSCPHYIISEPSQTVFAEFTPNHNPVQIALPSGRYRIQRVCNNEIAYRDIDCISMKPCTLSLNSLKTAPPTVFSRKGALERPALSHIIIAGALVLPIIPIKKSYYSIPVLSYSLLDRSIQACITGGYGQYQIEGSSLTVNSSVIHVGGTVGTLLHNSRHRIVFGNIEAGLQLNKQQPIRHEEKRFRSMGYEPLQFQKTTVYFCGLSGTITPFLFNKYPVYCKAGLYDFLGKTAKGYRHHLRIGSSIQLGIIM